MVNWSWFTAYKFLFCNVLTIYNAILHTAQCTGGCQNGGTCTSPDVCTCAPGWTGSDCGTGEWNIDKLAKWKLINWNQFWGNKILEVIQV